MKDKNWLNTSGSTSAFPYRRFDSVIDGLNKQMDSLFTTGTFDMSIFDEIQPKGNFPKLNVKETSSDYVVEAAVAGFAKEDVELELKENILYLRGNHDIENEVPDLEERILKNEIAKRSFRRAIRFPEKVDDSNITCSYANGIITCIIGKAAPDGPKTTKININ